ncbi:hypothetical protein BDD12DRAFT_808201 [Trichophaea hybrida]|nr:hypothetical protein BDD12DRAFT_808201 [Trichophaea hybrida]
MSMSSTTTAAATDREVLVTPASPTAGSATSSTSPTPAPTPTPTPETTSAVTPAPETATDHKAEGDATEGAKKKRYCTHRKCAKEREEKEAAEKAEKEKVEKEKEKEKEKAAEKEDKEKAEKESKKDKKDKKKNKKKNKKKSKKRGKGRKDSSNSDSDSSSDESDSDDEETVAGSDSSSDSSDSSSDSSSSDSDFEGDALVTVCLLLAQKLRKKSKKQERKKAKAKKRRKEERKASKRAFKDAEVKAKEAEGDGSRASVLEYKRVDELFDKELHDWDVRDTVPHSKTDKYSSFIFTVRRIFDYESRYVETLIDVKSTLLKDALSDIMGDIRGISLVEDVPEVDPNMLFNYYPELTEWVKQASNPKPATEDEDKVKQKKMQQKKKKLDPTTGVPVPPLTDEEKKQQIKHVKLLIEYLDTDYKNTKATLFPLLENKSITFDLLWAVLKPGTIMYTTCAGSNEPRAFKLEYAQMNVSFMRGKWWSIEGRYLEYDGKDNSTVTGKDGKKGGGFGWGSVMVDIEAFKGARKIGSLACYPLEYRKDSEELKAKLIERGKKFVSLRGMQYKSHNGLAFMKKKRQYLKVHVKGRIMIDPVTFRRINPNYIISSVKSRNNEAEEDENANYFHIEDRQEDDEGDESEACSQCCCTEKTEEDEEEKQRKAMRFVKDEKGDWHVVTKGEEEDKSMKVETLEQPADDEEEDKEPELEDEDYLIASPVVLGWAFNEKLWLEFPVATVEEITWNDKAFDTLVLPEEQKAIVRALVESHSGSTSPKTIDDFITGKGRGLVPPGVGKTLTAEGIAELLRRPLYCVSSGELGTNPAQLEHELQKILDIAQGWGAVLLLDEADVFLERRSSHDLHRNALVSIFLRLLEYFQGILFLTTNRVETFDEAFQSRIHVALRYNDLDRKAKRIIWRTFLSKVSREEPGSEEREIITLEELDNIARKDLNGRQIKNVVRTSQALANSKGRSWS